MRAILLHYALHLFSLMPLPLRLIIAIISYDTLRIYAVLRHAESAIRHCRDAIGDAAITFSCRYGFVVAAAVIAVHHMLCRCRH